MKIAIVKKMNENEIDRASELDSLSKNNLNQELISTLKKLISKKAIFIDVGANIGQYTVYADRIMRRGSIYAIEPDPKRFERLKSNCLELEELSDNSIYPLNIAISNKDTRSSFYIGNSSVSGGLERRNLSRFQDAGIKEVDWEEISVEVYKLDSLFEKIDPDLIKIDVSGSELKILQGSIKILRRGKARFLIDGHFEAKTDSVEVNRYMKSFGYVSKRVDRQYLFVNPQKSLIHRLSKIYRQNLPVVVRQWLKS